MTIRVLIADDQALVRHGLRLIVDATPGMTVVAEADNGRDAVTKALHLIPDVCLLDIEMPELDGIEATLEITRAALEPSPKIVIITTFDLDDYVFRSLEAGATGFLLKSAGPELLIEAIRAAHAGDALISPVITTRLLQHVLVPSRVSLSAVDSIALTEREEEVLLAVADGLANSEAAALMHISVSTVKAYVGRLMSKTGARNRVELVIWAYETGRKR